MCEVIKHRGPEQIDYFLDKDVGLGIDRLKIIDLVTGAQPIHNEDETIWIVFNGEIYDYERFRRELESLGHSFYTESDTECIVHAYEEWGNDCASHLHGMFAFAIWDTNKKVLYLARDRFGKKPLYYSIVDDFFLFGSEIKSLLQYDRIAKKMDYRSVDFFFTYGYIPSPLSIFQGIQKLPPGYFGVYQSGKFTVTQYWDFRFRIDESQSEDSLIETLFQKIERAVKIRMRSDVPLGAFLSGGIDSSAVVSIMSRYSETPVRTISIDFNDRLSEVKYSREMAEYLKTDHHEYTVTPDAYKILPKLIWHFDEPFADSSMIPTYYLSKVARKEVTVALSGDGGDELFMGYPFLNDPESFSMYTRIPPPITAAALTVFSRVAKRGQNLGRINIGSRSATGKSFFQERFVERLSINDPSDLKQLYSRDFLSKHSPSDTYNYMYDLIEKSNSRDKLDAVDYATIRSYMEEDILVKVDRMSMAVSLEVRCPLLDQELAEFVGTIPSRFKMNGKVMKYVFKKMVVRKGLLPPEIAYRKKQGFTPPIQSWLQGEWKEIMDQMVDQLSHKDPTGILNLDRVRSIVKNPHRNSSRLFAIAIFLLWHKMYLEENCVSEPTQSIEQIIR